MPRNSNFKYHFERINGELYHVLAEYQIDRVKDIQGLKHHLGCTHVFKNNNKNSYLICNEVQIIEPITENTNELD